MKLDFRQIDLKQVPGFNDNYLLTEISKLRDLGLDFEVNRVYFITGIKGDTSGHCHMVERELFLLPHGTCTAVIDSGDGIKEYPMAAGQGFHVGNYVWHQFKDFSDDAMLMAISSTEHNGEDYIRDYEEYQAKLKEIGVEA